MADQGVALHAPPRWRGNIFTRFARWGGVRLFSISIFLLSARLVGAAAGFFVQLVLARCLSPHDLGIYFTATSLAVIGGVVAAHGYPSIATRFVSRYRKPSGAPLLRSFVRHAQFETMLLALAIGAMVPMVTVAWPRFEGETRAAIIIAAATIPCVAAFRLYGSLATATRSFKLAYLPDVCLKPIFVLTALGVVYFAWRGISLVQVMLSLAIATIVLSVAQYFLLARRFPVELTLWRRIAGPRTAAVRRVMPMWRREAHAVLLVAVFAQFLPELSILISTPVLSASEIGVFGLCLKLAFLVGFFVLLTQNIATPDLADALSKQGERRDRPKFAALGSAAAAATFIATLLCALWGDEVLRVFGADFVAGHTALVLLVAAQLVRAVFGPTNAVLTLVGEQKINLLLAAASVAVLGISTALSSLLFGLDGAALAVLLTTLFWSGTSATMLHRRTGLRVDLFAAYPARNVPAAIRAART